MQTPVLVRYCATRASRPARRPTRRRDAPATLQGRGAVGEDLAQVGESVGRRGRAGPGAPPATPGTSSGATTEHPSIRPTAARVAEHGGLHPHHEVALLRPPGGGGAGPRRAPPAGAGSRSGATSGRRSGPPTDRRCGGTAAGGRQRLEEGHAVRADHDVGDAPAVGKADPRDHRAAVRAAARPAAPPAGSSRRARHARVPRRRPAGRSPGWRRQAGAVSATASATAPIDRRRGAAALEVQEAGQERRGEDEPGDRAGDAQPGRADDGGPGGGEEARGRTGARASARRRGTGSACA